MASLIHNRYIYAKISFHLLPKNEQILNHLLAQVMINTIDLLFIKETSQMGGQLAGGFKVTTEGLFDD